MLYILAIIGMAIPLLIIWAIVRGVIHLFSAKPTTGNKEISDRDFVIRFTSFAFVIVGLMAVFQLPNALYQGRATEGEQFAIQIIASMMLLSAGLLVKEEVGKLLMIMGVFVLAISVPFVFGNLGSAGTFVLVLLAFSGLIYAALRYSKGSSK